MTKAHKGKTYQMTPYDKAVTDAVLGDIAPSEPRVSEAFWYGDTWMVCRDSDNKVAVAIDADVTVGTETAHAVAMDTEDNWYLEPYLAVWIAEGDKW